MRFASLLVTFVIVINATAQQLSPVSRLFPEGTKTFSNVPYANDTLQKHLLDVYVPANSVGALPVVVWVHGGAWMMNDKYADMGYMVQTIRAILGSGFALASIDYRHSTTAVFPAQLDDCVAAVDFLYRNAAKFGIDAKRIGLMGFSAGGHLASLLGLRLNNFEKQPVFRVKAVVDFYGPSDFIALATNPDTAINNPRNPVSVLLGAMSIERPDLAAAASPVNYIDSTDPPFLIIHGEKDESVPVTQSRLLSSWMKIKGVKNELIIVPGAPHYGEMFDQEWIRARIIAFLKGNL